MKYELHIDELVLHGFAAADRYRLSGMMERELTRLLAVQGIPQAIARSGEIDRLDAGAFEVKPGSSAEAIGVQLAQAIYGGINTRFGL